MDLSQQFAGLHQENKRLNVRLFQNLEHIDQQNKALEAVKNELMTFNMKYNEIESKCKLKDLAINEFREQTENLKAINHDLRNETYYFMKVQVETLRDRDHYKRKYLQMLLKSDYNQWDYMDIVSWIITLDKERYQKYEDVLLQNMDKT